MREQQRQRAKGLAALLALVRSFSRVKADVCEQPGFLRERLVTVGALEGLFTRVQPAVGL